MMISRASSWTAFGPLGRAVQARDNRFVAGYLSARFEMEIPESEIERAMDMACRDYKVSCWSDSTWVMWFRNRFEALWTHGSCIEDVRFECQMNVFFIVLEETDEMLARLRKPESPLEEKREKLREARSKISRSNLAEITPINRVAARVT